MCGSQMVLIFQLVLKNHPLLTPSQQKSSQEGAQHTHSTLSAALRANRSRMPQCSHRHSSAGAVPSPAPMHSHSGAAPSTSFAAYAWCCSPPRCAFQTGKEENSQKHIPSPLKPVPCAICIPLVNHCWRKLLMVQLIAVTAR